MKRIDEIDKNLKVSTGIDKQDIYFIDVRSEPLHLYGLAKCDGFRRMPAQTAEAVNEGVALLASNTAGARVRFKTDSEYIAITCTMPSVMRFPHMPLTGSLGFDLYTGNRFRAMFVPPVDAENSFSGIAELGSREMREIMIGFPLYNSVDSVCIGLQSGARIEPAPEYTYRKPVVFYGSSITQGGCVSRPGLSYPAILSRAVDFDYINLGFSGSARGEDAAAEYIAGLEMSVFVMDYDHNAPNPEHLLKTHEKFFNIIRQRQPYLPIVIISKPDFRFNPDDGSKRREIVRRTYEAARARGDKNVWFIDGETLWGGVDWDSCTMDCCHPNDLGHWRMAKKIEPVLREILEN